MQTQAPRPPKTLEIEKCQVYSAAIAQRFLKPRFPLPTSNF